VKRGKEGQFRAHETKRNETKRNETNLLDESDGILIDGEIDNGTVTSNVEDGVEI